MNYLSENFLTWVGIVLCLAHSGIFSGLNLAFFSVSRLRLEAEANHNSRAKIVLEMRRDSNFLLTTILWGNVSANTLLALLSNSVMTGLVAFLFSTFIITFFGEICPQAYFSRRALMVGARLAPVLRFYQYLLYPLAKPTARFLDFWLGHEAIELMREKTLHNIILQHLQQGTGEINDVEGFGALNFMELDDILAIHEGQPINPSSIVSIESLAGKSDLMTMDTSSNNLVTVLKENSEKWVILIDYSGLPKFILNTSSLLRKMFHCHDPILLSEHLLTPVVIEDSKTTLGEVMVKLVIQNKAFAGEVLDNDVAIVWNAKAKRIITGADILADLLRGVSRTR